MITFILVIAFSILILVWSISSASNYQKRVGEGINKLAEKSRKNRWIPSSEATTENRWVPEFKPETEEEEDDDLIGFGIDEF